MKIVKLKKVQFGILVYILLANAIVAGKGEGAFFYCNPMNTPSVMADNAGTVSNQHVNPTGTYSAAITYHTGALVWKAEYSPFGEEQLLVNNKVNDKMFVGKEKDEETGLYYFGARYLQDRNARFVSVDPVGPVDSGSGKVNEKMLVNPQRLNKYAYALNNPFRYIDPNGAWAEDVHSGVGRNYGTYTWAKQVGFSDKQARTIANGNNRTDGGPNTSFLPLFGDQSRHFNEAHDGTDTRDKWANMEFNRAVKYAEDGDMNAALGHLGKGLHSLQDKFAHRNWDTGFWGAAAHPAWYDDWTDPRNAGAAENTKNESVNYLKTFKEKVFNNDKK